jgi:hypothetical protein
MEYFVTLAFRGARIMSRRIIRRRCWFRGGVELELGSILADEHSIEQHFMPDNRRGLLGERSSSINVREATYRLTQE